MSSVKINETIGALLFSMKGLKRSRKIGSKRNNFGSTSTFTPFNISNADPEGRHLLMLLGNCYFSPINRLYILIILPEGRIIKYNRRLKGEKV